MSKQYEKIDGRNRAVVWRKKGEEKTDDCPFCGRHHTHGKGEGHRSAHCMDTLYKSGVRRIVSGFFASDGTYLAPKDGYIIKEYY